MSRISILLLLLGPLLTAWSHVLSPEAFFSVNPRVDYQDVRDEPDAYAGTTLMLAGMIVENTTSREGTTLEIDCYTRDPDDVPEAPDPTCGRFLARSGELLVSERYRTGRLVTLTGTVVGEALRGRGEEAVRYPLFEIGEIYLWPEPSERPRYYPYCGSFWGPCWGPYWDPFCRSYGRYGWWYDRGCW